MTVSCLANAFVGTVALAPGETFDSTDFLEVLAPEYLTFELGAD
jgi:hypothetical protein